MSFLVWILFLANCAGTFAQQKTEAQLTELVKAVRSADYRGDRAALDRLDAALARLPDSSLDDYRAYWRGFARWRRAINGFNETPTPTDLAADLDAAIGQFKVALERRPGWIEARLAMVGSLGNLIYLAGDDAAKREAILAQYKPVGKNLQADGPDNPRVLWIIGGLQLGAPPPTGGDPARAAATMSNGLECSWREALAGTGPGWVPAWGGPENLMNLAYLYSHSALNNKAAALAYAQGALTMVPEWHYVREVLMPQIEAMPDAGKQ
ncbi:MAG TPA: hypothetical protein VMR54_05685 [Thermoanaerobaculia bacterium]|nr:hypothetical protein [Thermoanaerobaculia bacterium]